MVIEARISMYIFKIEEVFITMRITVFMVMMSASPYLFTIIMSIARRRPS